LDARARGGGQRRRGRGRAYGGELEFKIWAAWRHLLDLAEASREPVAEHLEAHVEVPFRVAMLGGKVLVTCRHGTVRLQERPVPGQGHHLRRMQRPRLDLLRAGRLCRQPALPQVPRQGEHPLGAVPHLRRRGRYAHRAARHDHGAPAHRERGQGAAEGAGTAGARRGAGGRPDRRLTVEADRFFQREGLDLVCEVPVNLAQALLGTRLRVRTLDGKKIVLKVPPGTQPGRKFRIKGQGLERAGRRGDQIVAVRVELPEHLTPEQEALARQLADAAGLKY
jgi:molecular chaperone DnaJ